MSAVNKIIGIVGVTIENINLLSSSSLGINQWFFTSVKNSMEISHQLSWWSHIRASNSLPSIRKDFSYLCHISTEEWYMIDGLEQKRRNSIADTGHILYISILPNKIIHIKDYDVCGQSTMSPWGDFSLTICDKITQRRISRVNINILIGKWAYQVTKTWMFSLNHAVYRWLHARLQ